MHKPKSLCTQHRSIFWVRVACGRILFFVSCKISNSYNHFSNGAYRLASLCVRSIRTASRERRVCVCARLRVCVVACTAQDALGVLPARVRAWRLRLRWTVCTISLTCVHRRASTNQVNRSRSNVYCHQVRQKAARHSSVDLVAHHLHTDIIRSCHTVGQQTAHSTINIALRQSREKKHHISSSSDVLLENHIADHDFAPSCEHQRAHHHLPYLSWDHTASKSIPLSCGH